MKKGFIAVLTLSLLASLLFIVNRGFGGGHGKYDSALGVLGLPWILIPWPDFLFKYDFVWLVLIPLVSNLLVVLVVGKLVLRHARRKP